MSKLTPLLFLIIGGLCFYAGYTVGIKKAPLAASAKTVAEPPTTSSDAIAQAEPHLEPDNAEGPIEPAEIDKAVVLAHEHSLRAAKQQITFTDKQGRELIAEVIEANADSLKVRRVADNAKVDLPVVMLCAKDQAFATYLAQTMTPTAAPTSKKMEDIIWDELFK